MLNIEAKLGTDDRLEFWRTLSGWLTSGGGKLPVNESIRNTCEVFSRDEYRAFTTKMETVMRLVDSGQSPFYAAIRQANIGFKESELAIIEAAERNNQLRVAVPALVEALSMSTDARRNLMKSIVPLAVGGFMLIMMSVGVMVFMLPTVLEPVLERNPGVLEDFPFVIRWYWYSSVFLRAYPYVPIAVFMTPVLIFLFRNTSFLRPYVEKAMMSFGPTRRITMAMNGVLVVYFMPALVRSYMPLPDVLRALANAVTNMEISSSLKQAASYHEAGQRLGESLKGVPLRGAFRSAVDAGERTGAIADRVDELKKPFSNEFERIMRKAVSTLKFLVMAILMPFFVMTMYTSLVAPIFALMEF